jgi:hypothetical protein
MSLPDVACSVFRAVLVVLTGCAGRAALAGEEVNPLTGAPLSLERSHWALEQARLEEQLQASLLNRRKFEIERQRLESGLLPGDGANAGDAGARAPAPGRLAPSLPGGASGTPALDGRSVALSTQATLPAASLAAPDARAPTANSGKSPRRRLRARSAQAATTSTGEWTVIGVQASGTRWCVLIEESDRLEPVCAGQSRHGHHVDAVAADRYTVDGVPHRLDIPGTRLARWPMRTGAGREASARPGQGGDFGAFESDAAATDALESATTQPASFDPGPPLRGVSGPGRPIAGSAEPGDSLPGASSVDRAGLVPGGVPATLAGTPLELRVPAEILRQ